MVLRSIFPSVPKYLVITLLSCLLWQLNLTAQEQQLYLSRFVPNLKYSDADLTRDTDAATYKAIFGEGDEDGHRLNSISRIGELTVQPDGASALVSRPNEEYVLYVTEGNGTLIYGSEEAALKKNDFLYIPAGVRHGISNSGSKPIKVLFMGDTTSTRDRLASASQMKSFFIMDFSAHGTNKPHQHGIMEEEYLILRGHGYLVAGQDAYGNPERHPSQAGDAFYFAAGTRVGFFSLNKEGEEHSIILAIRSVDSAKSQKK